MPELAYKYAVEVLKKPWRDAEDQPGLFPYGMIKPEMLMALNTPEIALKYAEHFNIKPWPSLPASSWRPSSLTGTSGTCPRWAERSVTPGWRHACLSPVPETETETIYPTEQEVANYSYYHPGRPCRTGRRRTRSTRTGWQTSMTWRFSAESAAGVRAEAPPGGERQGEFRHPHGLPAHGGREQLFLQRGPNPRPLRHLPEAGHQGEVAGSLSRCSSSGTRTTPTSGRATRHSCPATSTWGIDILG